MSQFESKLPIDFSELNPFVSDWSLPSEQARAAKRIDSSIQELRNFHMAVFTRFDEIVKYLNQLPNDPDALPIDAKNLYDLALMAMEAAAPIDLGWSSPDIEDVFPLQRFKFNSY
jgi:hypothetical protein